MISSLDICNEYNEYFEEGGANLSKLTDVNEDLCKLITLSILLDDIRKARYFTYSKKAFLDLFFELISSLYEFGIDRTIIDSLTNDGLLIF